MPSVKCHGFIELSNIGVLFKIYTEEAVYASPSNQANAFYATTAEILDRIVAAQEIFGRLILHKRSLQLPAQHTKAVGGLLGGLFGLRLVSTWPSNGLAFFHLRVLFG